MFGVLPGAVVCSWSCYLLLSAVYPGTVLRCSVIRSCCICICACACAWLTVLYLAVAVSVSGHGPVIWSGCLAVYSIISVAVSVWSLVFPLSGPVACSQRCHLTCSCPGCCSSWSCILSPVCRPVQSCVQHYRLNTMGVR